MPTVDTAHLDLAAADQAKQQTFSGACVRQRGLDLHASSESTVEPLNGSGPTQHIPLAVGEMVEG